MTAGTRPDRRPLSSPALKFLRRLDDYVDRALAGAEIRRVEEHLAECLACASAARFERSLLDGIRVRLRRIAVPDQLRSSHPHPSHERDHVPGRRADPAAGRAHDGGAEAGRLAAGRAARTELEALGAVPLRAAVGHGARGLFGRRRRAGTTSRTTRRAAGPTAGARTACWASPTASAGCASRWRCGTGAIRSSRSACSASPAPRATTARTSRSCTTTSTPRRPTRTCKALYKYPQAEFPYEPLVEENRRARQGRARVRAARHRRLRRRPLLRRVRRVRQGRADDMLIRITVANRGPEAATAARAADAVVPQHLGWGRDRRGLLAQARARRTRRAGQRRSPSTCRRSAATLVEAETAPTAAPALLFTENETNARAAVRRAQPAARTSRTPSTSRGERRDAMR